MRLAVIVALAALAAPASAQPSEVFLEQAIRQSDGRSAVATPRLGPLETFSAVVSVAPPGANVLVLEQEGTGNNVSVEQVGIDNAALVTQEGAGNQTDLVQTGDDNLFMSLVVGDGNRVDALQTEGGNAYGLFMVGSGTDHTVRQLGGDNTAVQVVSPGATPVDVEQRGSGASVYIQRR